jgi:hypothetical protein
MKAAHIIVRRVVQNKSLDAANKEYRHEVSTNNVIRGSSQREPKYG